MIIAGAFARVKDRSGEERVGGRVAINRDLHARDVQPLLALCCNITLSFGKHELNVALFTSLN